MGFFDRPDKEISRLHREAEDLASKAKYAKPDDAARMRAQATRLVKRAAFVRGTRED